MRRVQGRMRKAQGWCDEKAAAFCLKGRGRKRDLDANQKPGAGIFLQQR
jgi:hypothetical protein